jgi:transposase-like protein
MKNRQWSAQKKLQIVLEGLQGKLSISELCNRYEIHQSLYYKWRDKVLASSPMIFENEPDKKVERLESKVKQLTQLVGQLTIELKKTEKELEWLES